MDIIWNPNVTCGNPKVACGNPNVACGNGKLRAEIRTSPFPAKHRHLGPTGRRTCLGGKEEKLGLKVPSGLDKNYGISNFSELLVATDRLNFYHMWFAGHRASHTAVDTNSTIPQSAVLSQLSISILLPSDIILPPLLTKHNVQRFVTCMAKNTEMREKS